MKKIFKLIWRANIIMLSFGVGFCFQCSAQAAVPAPENLTVIKTIPGNDASFDYAVVDNETRQLFVGRGDGVMSVDLDTLKTISRFVPGSDSHMPLLLPHDKMLVTNEGTSSALLFNLRTKKIVDSIPTGKGPDGAVYDAPSGLVFVVNSDYGNLAVINLKTRKLISNIPVGDHLEYAVSDGKGHVYVNNTADAEIAVIDTAKLAVTARFPLPNCALSTGLAIDPQSGVLLSACQNMRAVAVNSKTGAVITTLDIDRVPDQIIFDAAFKTFLVPCARDATLIAISEHDGTLTVEKKIPTAIGAHAAALDPLTGRIYLPAANFTITSTGFQQTPGTFRILVLGTKS